MACLRFPHARQPSQSSASPTVVVSRRVHPGREDEFRAWDQRIRAAAATCDGFLGSEMQPPTDSHPGEWVTVYSFSTVEQLDRWLSSPERQNLIVEAGDLISGSAREQHVAGLRPRPETGRGGLLAVHRTGEPRRVRRTPRRRCRPHAGLPRIPRLGVAATRRGRTGRPCNRRLVPRHAAIWIDGWSQTNVVIGSASPSRTR